MPRSWDYATNSGADPCQSYWTGVYCAAGAGGTLHVLQLFFAGILGLVGSLPNSISNFVDLRLLLLRTVNVTGPMPPSLGSLTSLSFLGNACVCVPGAAMGPGRPSSRRASLLRLCRRHWHWHGVCGLPCSRGVVVNCRGDGHIHHNISQRVASGPACHPPCVQQPAVGG